MTGLTSLPTRYYLLDRRVFARIPPQLQLKMLWLSLAPGGLEILTGAFLDDGPPAAVLLQAEDVKRKIVAGRE